MPIVAIKHEGRCKICTHEKRAEIDELILLKMNRKTTGPKILAQLAEWGMENPTLDNLKGHTKSHVKVVTDEEVAAQRAIAEQLDAEIRAGKRDFEDLDEGLRFLWTVYMRDIQRRYDLGEDIHLTHDHAMKIAAEMTKRKHSEAQNDLMKAIGGGIQRALSGPMPALNAGSVDYEVIEAEDAELTELGAGNGDNAAPSPVASPSGMDSGPASDPLLSGDPTEMLGRPTLSGVQS